MLRSIRWTLQLWHAGLLAIVLTAFGAATFYEIGRSRYAQIDADLERTVQLIAAGMRPPRPPMFDEMPDPFSPFGPFDGPPTPELFLSPALVGRFDDPADHVYFMVWGRDGEFIDGSRNAPAVPAPPRRAERPRDDDFDYGPGPHPPHPPQPPTIRRRDGWREAVVQGPFGVSVVVGRPTDDDARELRRLAWLMVGTGVGVLVVGLAGGLALASRVTRPIRAMTAAAETIGAANLSKRIDLADTESELGRLGAVLNDAFDRLEAAFRQQVRFTADASHELRTPLAVMHTTVQLALSRERSADDYRRSLQTCQRASTRMKDLVDSLLLLAGVDAGRLTLERGRVDLADVVRDSVELIMPIAAGRRVTIDVELPPLTIDGDATRLGQVVTNLLSNAVRYNHDGGRVRVRLSREGDMAVLAVADTGVGIPAEHRAHLFERFYRVDPARSRAEGGSGLRLAIGRSIVAAHGGSIGFESPADGGTVFTVRLPIADFTEPSGLRG